MSLESWIRNASDEELLKTIQGYPAHCNEHRFAAIEIHRRESEKAEKDAVESKRIEAQRHQESIALDKESIIESKRANFWAVVAIVIASVALLVAAMSLVWQWQDRIASKQTPQKLEVVKPLSQPEPAFYQPATNVTPTNQAAMLAVTNK